MVVLCAHMWAGVISSFLPFWGFSLEGRVSGQLTLKKAKPCCVKKLARTHNYKYTHKAFLLVIAQRVNFNKQFLSSNGNYVQLQINFYRDTGF